MNEEPFLLNGPVRNLSRIWRYSSLPLHEPENVAEHNFWVAWNAMQIGHWLESEDDKIMGEESILQLDWKIIYELAIVHDFAECFTGDMIRPVKYSSTEFREAYRKLEDQAVAELLPQLPEPVRKATFRSLSAQETFNTLEVRIVKFADLLSVWNKLDEEANIPNVQAQRQQCAFINNYAQTWTTDPDLGALALEIFRGWI